MHPEPNSCVKPYKINETKCCLLYHLGEKPHDEERVKRKRGPAKSVCPYNKASALQHMRDNVLGTVHDIEQMLKLGRETHSCPYYAARLAVPPAQVTLSSPYWLTEAPCLPSLEATCSPRCRYCPCSKTSQWFFLIFW